MSSNPARDKALRSYWAAVQKWAEQQGMEKEDVHLKLKEIMGFDHLIDVKTSKLMEMAFEISTMANGGPGL